MSLVVTISANAIMEDTVTAVLQCSVEIDGLLTVEPSRKMLVRMGGNSQVL